MIWAAKVIQLAEFLRVSKRFYARKCCMLAINGAIIEIRPTDTLIEANKNFGLPHRCGSAFAGFRKLTSTICLYA
jgi:hypothetical protein